MQRSILPCFPFSRTRSLGTSPQLWQMERPLQDVQLARPPSSSPIGSISPAPPALSRHAANILTFSISMSSLALTHQIILKCILFGVLSQSNEKNGRILSRIYHPHATQRQINSNVLRPEAGYQCRDCSISLHCLGAKAKQLQKNNHSRA